MIKFLTALNVETRDYILKGGMALIHGHGLTRTSEDLDFAKRKGSRFDFLKFVDKFCKINHYTYRTVKQSKHGETVKINYSDTYQYKVETSDRENIEPATEEYEVNQEAIVFTISALAIMKSQAYIDRGKDRDLYDMIFIVNHCWEDLNKIARSWITSALALKGVEHYDYIICNQPESNLPITNLAEEFLEAFNKCGVLYEQEESIKRNVSEDIVNLVERFKNM